MDVSFTNVLEGARQYFQGLPVPSTAGDTSLTHNLTTTTSSTNSYKNESTSTNASNADSKQELQRYPDNRPEESFTSSFWNPSDLNELRAVEPCPPRPTKVEVPDTRPSGENASFEGNANATELTEMQPSCKQQRPAEYKQFAKNHESHLQSPVPVYQQLNNVNRSQYSSAENASNRSVYPTQRAQYYPRYHHPDITKSAPVPHSQNSAVAHYPPVNVPAASPNNREQRNSPSVQAQSHVEAQRLPTSYPNSVGPQCQNHQSYHNASYNRSNSQNAGTIAPHSIDTGNTHPLSSISSSSHIPSSHNPPAHIPTSHMPPVSLAPSSSSSTTAQQPQHLNRIDANASPYQSRPMDVNYSSQPPPSSQQVHYAQAPSTYHPVASPSLHNPHVSPHNTPSFQPHSPTYPPPSPRSMSYSTVSPTPQSYQNVSNYPNSYHPTAVSSQSSYHSFQKNPSQSTYYSSMPRPGHCVQQSMPGTSVQNSAPISSYSNNSTTDKTVACNGTTEVNRPADPKIPYSNYQPPIRTENTHNLPPIAAFSSYHNRNTREVVNKNQQSPQRQRAKGSVVMNGRVPATLSSYSHYTQGYSTYATTIAPSHRANNSSTSTTVASIGSTYAASESSGRPESYPQKDYSQMNSSSSAQATQTAPPQSRANGTSIKKRESPLDLSVKTVKTSADSTAQDDVDNADKSRPMLPPQQIPFAPNGRLPMARPAAPVCAPKVEFYPDFNSAPLRNSQGQAQSQRLKMNSQQSYQPLPHMSTFKKSSLPTPTYYPNDSLPRTSRHSAIMDKLPVQDYASDSRKYYPVQQGANKDQVSLKRESPFGIGGPSNKYPKMDVWDHQKMSGAKVANEQHNKSPPVHLPNGNLVAPASFDQRSEMQQYALEANRYPNLCDKKNYSDAIISNPSYVHPTSKSSAFAAMPTSSGTVTYSAHRSSTKVSHYVPSAGGTSHSFEQSSNTGADKRILNLLRNSLESKQKEDIYGQQPGLTNHNQQSFQNKVVAPVEPKTNIGRHNLSPFTAASLLERNSNTPPHYKFYVPKAVDSITQEGPRGNYASRVNPAITWTSKDDILGSRDSDNQIYRDKDDGLAAILAAKIRTKAELKQVGLVQNTWKSTATLLQEQNVTPKDTDTASTSTPNSGSSVGSPPKLTREKTPVALPRRRLFSKSEEENMLLGAATPGASSATTVPPSISPRAVGPRSSSETSVFDFRESDSEGEMPVLERQTLEEMRRDRKQLSKVQPPVPLNDAIGMDMESSQDIVKIELKEKEKIPELDSCWAATCDKFMEQLRYGDSVKKRGRKKRPDGTPGGIAEPPILPEIAIENIKHEVLDETNEQTYNKPLDPPKLIPIKIKQEPEDPMPEPIIEETNRKKTPNKSETTKDNKSSGEDSDETPLIKRQVKKKLNADEEAEPEEDDLSPGRKRGTRRGSRIKLESSSENDSSSEGSDTENKTPSSSVAERLRVRKQSGASENSNNVKGMKLRSSDTTPQKSKTEKEMKTPPKSIPQKSKPKPLFGDGSDFRPGWEEEVYVYKKSLRMPTRLITVSKPSRFHRLSTSLPDLDPGSPALSVSMDSSDVCLSRKRVTDSDLESNCSFSIKNDDEDATSSTTISCPTKMSRLKCEGSTTSSIVDVLAQKVGTGKKEVKKKVRDKDKDKEKPKIVKKSTNEPELLPTPSLAPLLAEESPSKKGKSPIKNNKNVKPIKVTDSFLLGYFRKETVNNFRNAFKNNHTVPNEFSTFVLKSRTRTETRVMKKQATIKEVFGEDRPASAPPMQNHAGDTSQDDDSQNESKTITTPVKTRTLKEKVVSRLRNAGILKGSKDKVVNTKKESLTKRRRKDLLKTLSEKKLKRVKKEPKEEEEEEEKEEEVEDEEEEDEEEEGEEEEDEDATQENNEQEADNNEDVESQSKRKFRTGRRKFRSGFDYIRKKKKPPLKKDDILPKERKRQGVTRSHPECVADIQAEIRTWVIKKGVGETILHRAARLGYTDVAAYCLEKLNCPPSPKDNAGYTPLHEACSRGHLEIAKLLLAYGANVSESANGGIRPLHEAAENGDAELVRLLLSYGADPLLATYAGQTPLVLANDNEAYRVLQQHIDDIQGHKNVPWHFQGPCSLFDPQNTGFNPLENPPETVTETELDEIEMEVSDVNLPVLFTLLNEQDKWILLPDLMTALKMKSRDALLRQINPKAPSGPPAVAHRDVMREMKLADFLEQSRCCHLMSAGEKINVRGSKVTLIKYNERVRSLLNVERVVISLR